MWALYIIGYLFLGVVSATLIAIGADPKFDESDDARVLSMIVIWPIVLIILLYVALFPKYIKWANGLRNGGWRNILPKIKRD